MGCDESKMAQDGTVRRNGAPPKQTNGKPAAGPAAKNSVAPLKGGPIKFTHFNDGGRCVPLLMIFAYKDIPFENEIIKFEDWAEFKPKTPMGTLPLMSVGSEQIVSSLAMLTYLGSISDLKGCDNAEQARVDAIVSMIEDLRSVAIEKRGLLILGYLDDAGRLEAEKMLCAGPIPNLAKFLEGYITGDKFLVSKLTIADFWLYGTLSVISEALCCDIWSRMGPKVCAWKIEFESLAGMSEVICKPDLKLTYFKGKGRIAPLDLILAYGNRTVRREYVLLDNWPKVKPTTQLGFLPILHIGDDEVGTTLSMLHYLGSEMALRGCDTEEDGAVQVLVNIIDDIRNAMFPLRFSIVSGQLTDEAEKKQKADEFYDKHFSSLVQRLESTCTDNFLFSKLTIADFWLYGTIQVMEDTFMPEIWSKMGAKIQKWRSKFENIKRVKECIEADTKPKMKLTYFTGVRGRIEPYRMMLAQAGIKFDFEGINLSDWPKVKPTTKLGTLPILTVGDEEINTSVSIMYYIAMEAGLQGAADESWLVLELIQRIEEVRSTVFPSRFLIRQGKMEEATIKEKADDFIANGLKSLADGLEKRATGDRWILSQLSVVDFWLYGTMEIIEDSLIPDVWQRMGPKVQAWKTQFNSLPRVKEYLANRSNDNML